MPIRGPDRMPIDTLAALPPMNAARRGSGTQSLSSTPCGSDGGGEHWAVIASLVETCKMNAVDPQAYLRDVLSKIVARHPMSRVDELLPFAYVPAADRVAA
jgi:hypothetical protein